ncbi:MAG: phosphate signaling complex protein PhoU [Chloroflexi bacterium]|jgi:phosphate transport system protein|nr:phosphate signaling complex protein PhoU [Chloroflexota bacterium]
MTATHPTHLPATPRIELDREWDAIRTDLFRLSDRVDTAIDRAITALINHDTHLARNVVEADRTINARRYQLEDACLTTMVRQQPVASDLRRIIAAMHVAGELERMADLAEGIARIALKLDAATQLPLSNFDRMAQAVRRMLRSSLYAFAYDDIQQADRVAVMDDKIDQFYQQNMRTLLTYMLEDSEVIPEATYLLWVSHNLERIGDRCVNVSQRALRR